VPFSRTSDYINGPIPVQFFKDPLALKEGYDLVLVGRSRVSGRAAQQIRIVSRDASRYGITVWLDQDTGLLLKMDTLDAAGNLIEQLQVTEIKVTEEPDSYFAKIDKQRLPAVSTLPSVPKVQHAWTLNWLPEGMEIIKQDVHRLAASQEIVEYVMVSDGIFDISVYISKTNNRPEDGGWLKHESNTLFSINNGTIEVTVIGKIPAKTANAIATSIGPVNAG
jgi:sigma-E factor negative regulatory protein RseB